MSLLEIRFKDEVGTGLGPTLEFYSLTSLEMQNKSMEIWHDSKLNSKNEYLFAPMGLYPSANFNGLPNELQKKHLTYFHFLGKLVAKSILDARMLDINLSPLFYYWMTSNENRIIPSDLKEVDENYLTSIKYFLQALNEANIIREQENVTEIEKTQKLNTIIDNFGGYEGDFGISFIIPGSECVELVPGGSKKQVNLDNLEQYLYSLTNWILVRGIEKQMNAFLDGFTSLMANENLKLFHPTELSLLIGGRKYEAWTSEELHRHCRLDHGYTHSSKTIGYLFNVLSQFDESGQRNFIQFVTGSPKLPIEGFAGLSPPLTIVKKQGDANQIPDSYLPSVMTCVNYLKLPDYTSEHVLKEKLEVAINDGQKAFHLS